MKDHLIINMRFVCQDLLWRAPVIPKISNCTRYGTDFGWRDDNVFINIDIYLRLDIYTQTISYVSLFLYLRLAIYPNNLVCVSIPIRKAGYNHKQSPMCVYSYTEGWLYTQTISYVCQFLSKRFAIITNNLLYVSIDYPMNTLFCFKFSVGKGYGADMFRFSAQQVNSYPKGLL